MVLRATPDVVVVGGGLVGCLAARALARAGLTVRILERGPDLGQEASTAAAGMLSPQMEAAEDLLVEVPGPESGKAMLELCLAARAGYADFVSGLEAETGLDVGYRADGTLVVALTPVEAGRLRRSAEVQRARGLRAEILEAGEIRRLEPAVTEAAAVGLHLPDDHQVDPVRLMAAAESAVRSAPRIEVETGTAVRALLSTDRRVAGVETDRGPVSTGWVVLAAGAWSGGLEELPRPLPVRPVKGQMAAVRPRQPSIRGIVGGRGAYCVPRDDGRVVIGATVEERGFDDRVNRVEVDALVASAVDIVPALAGAEVVSRWAGLRPGTPDSLPVLGPDPDLPGLVYATGHYRNGILLAPLTAQCLAALVAGRPEPLDLSAFAPDRLSLTGWGRASGTGR
ncbi:MAG: glycine oxidase ThiO [Gemmatimonadota bacterium]